MGLLLQRRLDLPRYRALLANLLAIYQALEAALDARRDDPLVAPLRMPALYRSAALAADLRATGARPHAAQVVLVPATQAYVQRVAQLAAAHTPALVAHAYVRYLGDLHGGQLLNKLLADSLALDDTALRFYDFGNAAQVDAARAALRGALAALPVGAEALERIVGEARWAFAQHHLLFEQLL